MNFASERTTFQAKLIGVILSFVLALLAQIPFLMLGNGSDSSENVRTMLLFFVGLIALSTTLILLILPPFLKFTLLKSLNEIGRGVKSVNEGDLTNQVTVEVNDEFGLLAQNFNRMTKSLNEYSSEMENLVTQRTIELQHSLETLQSTQAQLIQSEKLASLGELTAGIAHEIQNPLNFVNNFSEMSVELAQELKEEAEKPEIDKELIIDLATDLAQNQQKINHHGKRASSIVSGMLEHSRTSTGERALTDINKLADEYLRLSYHGMRTKDKTDSAYRFNADYELIADQNLPLINVVPQDIGRVLLNLINNAFWAVNVGEAKPTVELLADVKSPKVILKTEHTGNQLIIKLIDNGIGMSEEVKAKIFQPFFTTKPAGQGTGG